MESFKSSRLLTSTLNSKLFHRYNVQDELGLLILHKHFDMEADERLVEYGPVATPWKIPGSGSVFGGRLVPRCWALKDGDLYPTEFGFVPGTEAAGQPTYPEPSFDPDFVQELNSLLEEEGLTDVFGLTVLEEGHTANLKGMHLASMDSTISVERTTGRVSIMMPVSAEERDRRAQLRGRGEEVAWSFGCAKALWDSDILPARICWVCEECE